MGSMSWGVMVGDPGIEPGVGCPGGFTVRCRTLQHVPQALVSSLIADASRIGQVPDGCIAYGGARAAVNLGCARAGVGAAKACGAGNASK